MIQIKILTKQKGKYFSLPNLEAILKQLEQLLGYQLDKTDYYDPNFNGFYLMPNTDHESSNGLLTNENAKNIFLLGIVNSEITDIINDFKPLGLIQWRLFHKNKRTIHAPDYVIKKNNLKPIIEFNNGYSMIGFTEYDGQDDALANSIKKYLTLCNLS